MSAKKRYDYAEAIEPDRVGFDPVARRVKRKRILRKLARDAVMEFADRTSCTFSTRQRDSDLSKAIAKELVR